MVLLLLENDAIDNASDDEAENDRQQDREESHTSFCDKKTVEE